LKKEVLNFWQQNKTQILDCLNVHDVNTWSSELEHDLKTNGAFIDQPAWQILAWMLQRDIVIWDVFHCSHTTIQSLRPWDPVNTTTEAKILVAHRNDEEYWSYDSQFKRCAKSPGHFWAILSRQPGNAGGSDSSRQ
jgi:hypothetical protein